MIFNYLHAPFWLTGFLIEGVYNGLAWVISVMLPPMAIFFPLFTILEDIGYLPRIAFNLDRFFKMAHACGKQALTMCMGFGCNAAGVVSCRIIDSPRERLIAILTNNFVPVVASHPDRSGQPAGYGYCRSVGLLFMVAIIIVGITVTLLVSWLLSNLLQGVPSSLQDSPYRKRKLGES